MGGTSDRCGAISFVRTLAWAFLVVLPSPAPARAYLETVESIEWLVADADLVVRGRLVQVGDDVHGDWIGWRRAVIEVLETIKGQPVPGGRVTVRHWGPGSESQLEAW